jgi:hypothetical protein
MLLLLPGLAYSHAVVLLRGHDNDDAVLLSTAKSAELEKLLSNLRGGNDPDCGGDRPHPGWREPGGILDRGR